MLPLGKCRNLLWLISNSNFQLPILKRRYIKRHLFHSLTNENLSEIPSVPLSQCAVEMQSSAVMKAHNEIHLVQIRKYAKRVASKDQKGKSNKPKVFLTDEELSEVFEVAAYHRQLKLVIDDLKSNFIKHLSMHTSAGNIDRLPVKIASEEYPLNELANISRKNPNLIAIDMSGFPEALKPAIQAINESGIGINPQQEGTMIYLAVPKVTRDFREKLVKNAKTLFNKAKENIRTVQNQYVKEAKQRTDLSEDIVYNSTQQIMFIAEQYAAEAENLLKIKQKELLPKL